jgi:hypothetical protein
VPSEVIGEAALHLCRYVFRPELGATLVLLARRARSPFLLFVPPPVDRCRDGKLSPERLPRRLLPFRRAAALNTLTAR